MSDVGLGSEGQLTETLLPEPQLAASNMKLIPQPGQHPEEIWQAGEYGYFRDNHGWEFSYDRVTWHPALSLSAAINELTSRIKGDGWELM